MLTIFARMLSVKYQRKNGNGRNYKYLVVIENVTQRKTQKGSKLIGLLLTKCTEMSTHTDRSAWSPEEVDSLENIDKEIQLVSTSSESHSTPKEINVISDLTRSGTGGGGQSNGDIPKPAKLHSSCDDLSKKGIECKNQKINRSTTFVSLKTNKKGKTHNYDHVQSKIKHYFKDKTESTPPPPPKPTVITSIKESSDKEDYLEQINKQLTKELDEKNAILSLLQENYERLLFKYAEAQNRIDELRFKFLTETKESKNHFQDDYMGKLHDVKCQKAVVAPFMKSEEPVDDTHPINRPSSLPLDNNLKFIERDLKATTPTDSEGLSSIITSMSGHSKILNSLDEENQINKKSNYLKYQTNNFILEEENPVNDPFDKVKNWQNSLPPLEQIETPETTLYNVFPNNTEAYSSSDTKYKNISKDFSDESCPDSWREERREYRKESEKKNESSRAVSLPNSFSKRNSGRFGKPDNIPTPKTDVPSGCIIQRRQKRAPLLRCSSLPAYDQDSVKSKNGIYIPPLDLGNVTLSDDESYCQQEYCPTATSSSFVTSRGNSIDRSIQTPQSFSSCKATISEGNSSSYPRIPRASKSTSITPERSRAMDLFFASKYERQKTQTSGCIKECGECDKSRNWCNVCGESISETVDFYRNRSNSCESVHETPRKEPKRTKPPFKRSVSFGSETLTPKFPHDETRNFFPQDSLDNFDVYATNLKARSQVVIKALTAHVNNCTQ